MTLAFSLEVILTIATLVYLVKLLLPETSSSSEFSLQGSTYQQPASNLKFGGNISAAFCVHKRSLDSQLVAKHA